MLNLKTVMGAAAIAVVTSTGAFAQTKITIGAPAWTGADAIGAVIKAIIEGPLQGEAEIVPGMTDGNIIFAGMDKGDGSVDVHPDIWMPNQQANWDAYIEEGS
ncbi:MAG: glycine betaine ABC transporter substrate-binding protein, partial [Candidatus Halichondribacter symbioticus]